MVMMTHLLWKEYRERWLPALLWAVAILGITPYGVGGVFCGDIHMFPPGLTLLLLVSVVSGSTGYTSELTQDRAQFTFSRPISWRMLLLAKVFYAAIICLGASLLAAGLFRLMLPEPYHDVATLLRLIIGAGILSAMLMASYIFGLACSPLLPGIIGGILAAIAVLLILLTINLLLGQGQRSNVEDFFLFFGLYAGIWFGAICAGYLVIRSNLVLGFDERLKRFVLVFTGVLGICLLSGVLLPKAKYFIQTKLLGWVTTYADINPSGRYAFIGSEQCNVIFGDDLPNEYRDFSAETSSRGEVVRIDNRATLLSFEGPPCFLYEDMVGNQENAKLQALKRQYEGRDHLVLTTFGPKIWAPHEKLIYARDLIYYIGEKDSFVQYCDLHTFDLCNQSDRYITGGIGKYVMLDISPDGKTLVAEHVIDLDQPKLGRKINLKESEDRFRFSLLFVDLQTDKLVEISYKERLCSCRWKSNDTVRYCIWREVRAARMPKVLLSLDSIIGPIHTVRNPLHPLAAK